ncbi:MAG: S41 family peptidase [candidate division KSB1 bacterium]|nr:S41 family peptidase [candidate division KSB1 bacterium]MDZ7346431.1 S41 family peptidase [candidate division KSB1 bacterium]
MKAKRYIPFLLFGLLAGSTLLITQFRNRDAYSSDGVREQLTRFQEVFALINNYYVEPPDREKLITGAINGMLSELDPHSVYIPKKNLERVTEQFEGSFEGIGIEFVVLNKILTVVSPIVGGPSEAVGIRPGDQIIRIEGQSAYGITEDEVLKKLRGPAGTQVKVTIRRPSEGTEFEVVITRDKIPIYSVMAAFMLDDRTGYIYLGRFARTTAQEVEEALQKLEKQGMKQLVFDLRGNSGGYLDQAFEVADKFIPGGYKIVYTRGRIRNSDQDFYSTDKGTHPLYPLVVLIDHGSASASEIVAGAIQDLDRGLVLGQTSFGKGLVQNQIPLSDGGALRLTVARYYTPSGRLIQRPYEEDNLVDYYNEAYSDSADARKPDSTKQYLTLAGRTVYGGGGITPDSILAPERITRFTNRLIVKRLFFEYAVDWAGRHKGAFKDFEAFKRDFKFDAAMLEEFKSLMKKHDIEFVEEAYQKDADYIALLIKAEIARQLWNSEHYYKVRITADREVEQAVRMMPEAERIKNLHSWNSAPKTQ